MRFLQIPKRAKCLPMNEPMKINIHNHTITSSEPRHFSLGENDVEDATQIAQGAIMAIMGLFAEFSVCIRFIDYDGAAYHSSMRVRCRLSS